MKGLLDEPLLRAPEAAELLGLSTKTVLRLALLGLVPAYVVVDGERRVYRFQRRQLEAWLETRMVRPVAETALTRARG